MDKLPQFAELIFAIPRMGTYSYEVPEALRASIQIGDWVQAPLGKKAAWGLVVNLFAEKQCDFEMKMIQSLLYQDLLSKTQIQLLLWSHRYYLCPQGEILRSMLPSDLLKGEIKKGERSKAFSLKHEFHAVFEKPKLNEEQERAFEFCIQSHGQFKVGLLQGVTGSGKTEVYLQSVESFLSRGKQVLILVPEISLTPQLLSRFELRFPNQVRPYHSALTPAQRKKIWWELNSAKSLVVVATRSGILLPFRNLGFIAIDEEHDSSFKQEERFKYHGRDLAIKRAQIEGIPVLLGSATPSLETYKNALNGKYTHLVLKKRATEAHLPQQYCINLCEGDFDHDNFLSSLMIKKIQERLNQKEQSIIFLNRRGFAASVICVSCGEVMICPNCDISLVLHKSKNILSCHYCEYEKKYENACPACSSLALEEMGIGTEKLELALQERFPEARVARLDRDNATTSLQSETLLSQFFKGEIDILVGTQLLVKGHDFPHLTFVGVLLADQSMNVANFRASERAYQTLVQVAGRAGRHDKAGEVCLQSFKPEHPVIQAALRHDYQSFAQEELSHRESLAYPPFAKLIQFRFSGNLKAKVKNEARVAANLLHDTFPESVLQVLGPAAGGVEKLRGKYRWNILLKLKRWTQIQEKMLELVVFLEKNCASGVRFTVDVDPNGGL